MKKIKKIRKLYNFFFKFVFDLKKIKKKLIKII